MKDIVILNGIHTAGKSTIGIELGQQVGFSYYPEVGKVIRQEWEARAGSLGAPAALTDAFDVEVMARESERDTALLTDPNLPLVETWHLGNMAYLLARNRQDLAATYTQTLDNALTRFRPQMVYVTVGEETFRRRARVYTLPEQMDALWDFYRRIDTATWQLYDRFGLIPIVIRNESSLNESVLSLTKELAERQIGPEHNRRRLETL